MSAKEEMVSGHDDDKSQEHQVITIPYLLLKFPTPNIGITTNNNTQASSSVVGRRPRGRPPGSKNKSKIPSTVTHVNPIPLSSHMLEISSGNDVSKSLLDYARRQGRSIRILHANGVVEHVKVRQSTGSIATLMGQFKILSISGTIHPSSEENSEELTIWLSDTTTHKYIEGSVIPPLVASGTMTLMVGLVASVANTTTEKLPSME